PFAERQQQRQDRVKERGGSEGWARALCLRRGLGDAVSRERSYEAGGQVDRWTGERLSTETAESPALRDPTSDGHTSASRLASDQRALRRRDSRLLRSSFRPPTARS